MDPAKGIERLEQLIAKGEGVLRTHREHPPNVIGFPTLDSGAFSEWKTQALVCLKSVFGGSHTYVEHFEQQVKQRYQGTVRAGIGILKAAKEDLAQVSVGEGNQGGHDAVSSSLEILEAAKELIPMEKQRNNAPQTNSVFVVHGHDEEMKQSVARVLSQLGLKPIILHEQANAGKTIIEKFEVHADVSFAVVLLSPDDMAFPTGGNAKEAKSRPRQNVILELGYFVGRLGRGRVCALKRGEELELPSDFSGIVYTAFDVGGNWKFELARELKAAQYDVDANTLL